MRGKPTVFIDQFGNVLTAKTVKELKEKVGGGNVLKMYCAIDGIDYHIGYVVGKVWLTAYEVKKLGKMED